MSAVTCTAEEQNVYLWKNRDGSFEYIRKNGAGGGGVTKRGTSEGYMYSVTLGNGTTQQITDDHWITGGGGGAHTDGRDWKPLPGNAR